MKKIGEIQRCLAEQGVDGWLLYDNHGSNRFAHKLLKISPHQVLTRRFFYWIPSQGEPLKIVHRIEAESLEHLPGKTYLYRSWQELEQHLREVLKNAKQIVMEYSARCANPNVSVVDGGTLEMVKSMGVDIRSSADVLQRFTSVLTETQITSHLEAARILHTTVAKAWDWIAENLKKAKHLTEYEVQQFILAEFKAQKCTTEEGPICAVNQHTAQPHYMATEHQAHSIEWGCFILIDLWCKQAIAEAVYADITRVAVAASEPTPEQKEVFHVVREAQKRGAAFVQERMRAGKGVKGFEVDAVCRGYIQHCGYGEYFTHRTGHNIDTQVHGGGANLDNLEMADERHLLPGMCFSIEPGIYLPGAFGVRLESDLLIHHDGSVEITGGEQEKILCLL